MKCPICGAICVCRKATDQCCACHRHKARTAYVQLGREIAHAALAQARLDEVFPELFPEMSIKGDSK